MKSVTVELARSLKEIPNELNTENHNSYQATCDASKNEVINYNFITFNYTNVLDRILDEGKERNIDLGSHLGTNGQTRKHLIGEIHHVHGALMEGVVLGVNDESQINNVILRKNSMFKDIFIKSRINSQMGERRTERADEIIDRSQIICIFGMSIGITDKRWWEKIVSWIMENRNRKLIIYTRGDEKLFKRKIPTRIIIETERVKREFWEKGRGNQNDTIYEQIKSRIFVIFNSNIFSFPMIKSITAIIKDEGITD